MKTTSGDWHNTSDMEFKLVTEDLGKPDIITYHEISIEHTQRLRMPSISIILTVTAQACAHYMYNNIM